MKKIALYAGSFDPITYGHLDLIERAEKIFSSLIVLVSTSQEKNLLFNLEERLSFVKEACRQWESVEVASCETLTVDFAKKKNISVLLRGIRNSADLDYELRMSWMNQQLHGGIETIFMAPKPENYFISSKLTREVAQIDPEKLEKFIPRFIVTKIQERLK